MGGAAVTRATTVQYGGHRSTEFDQAVRNTYKVLLTRGMRGTLLHSSDPETQAFLQRLVREVPVMAPDPQPVG